MNRPYIIALNLPCAGEADPFTKKDTVIGTIGKTQGVRSIANPQSMASSIRAQREPSAFLPSSALEAITSSFSGDVTLVLLPITFLLISFLSSISMSFSCWVQSPLRQAIQVR